MTVASGMRYQRFLDSVHARHRFEWYLEIGARRGRTFRATRSRTIAVDPYFRLGQDPLGTKGELHLFQSTSDAFFESGFLERNGIAVSMAFLDGMHLFEFLLRDFANTERAATPGSIIALHDCYPSNTEMTTRDLDNLPNGPWTGDVWKLVPILAEYRPDLKLTALDCRPSGLLLVSRLDPENRSLTEHYDEIVARFGGLEIGEYGLERLYTVSPMISARALLREGPDPFAAVPMDTRTEMPLEPVTP
ncbi:MAG: class I SAM-dependent methyltransferase [Pseudomonadota bacterium]